VILGADFSTLGSCSTSTLQILSHVIPKMEKNNVTNQIHMAARTDATAR
jgi:hypothetical protein